MDKDLLEISAFKLNSLTNLSKVTFWGKDCNPKIIFKNNRNYFEDINQVIAILESIPVNSMLVVNETNIHSKTKNIIGYYHI